MMSEPCVSSLLLALPDDIFAIISWSLSPRDLCNLSLCCRSTCALVASEKLWLTQCEVVGIVPHRDLIEWRKGVSSYKALCRFLVNVQPMIGIWVHQNPELGNVVYVMPGFVSVVGCRIIPQELGPLGIEDGPILWAPVFEILGNCDGSAVFFLHGREKENDYFYPGSVKAIDRTCNVLLLEVETRQQENEDKWLHSKSFANHSDTDLSRKVSRSNSGISRTQRMVEQNDAKVPFSRLAFSDRRKLLNVVASQGRQNVSDLANGPLFPRLRDDEENFQKDIVLLLKRRSLLMQMHKLGGYRINWKASPELSCDPTLLELSKIRRSIDRPSNFCSSVNDDDGYAKCPKRKTFGRYFRAGIKQIMGMSSSMSGIHAISKKGYSGSTSFEDKHAQLQQFLKSSDTIKLTLHASTMKLSSYRAWPNMHDSRFALYKLPIRVPKADHEYAGLWGGTFGWPPGRPTEDKPGKALFFLLLSYEESEGERNLIATKILEGTHYVLHPNGSAMFIVNIDQPSLDPFPYTDAESLPLNVKHAYTGEGIANGYGFRYPGSKPGSLFVLQNGLLAFIWKESRAVLTLQRLNLQDLLKKGEQVRALPPIANFSYLTKSYSNVFASFPNPSTGLSTSRQRLE